MTETHAAPSRVAVIGLGNMGLPMAQNLKKAGHHVVAFDLAEPARHAATHAGLDVASSTSAAVTGADVVITMLPAGAHVRSAWSEIVPGLRPGALVVDCSTVDVETARAVHGLGDEAGLLTLDAPVSGGIGGATAGTLTFMIGGTAEAFARGRPILAAMGQRLVHCGPAGNGQAAKICNNMILGISMIAVGEAFVLGEQLGLSHNALFQVASASSGQCWSLTSYCPVPGPVPNSPANNHYKPGFATALMLKDLRLAQQAAAASGAATPLGALATQLFALHAAGGHGRDDFSSVIGLMRAKAAVQPE